MSERVETPRGLVRIFSKATAAMVAELSMDPAMGMFSSPGAPAGMEKRALSIIAATPGSNVILAVASDAIVGFIALGPPSREQRWSAIGHGLLEALAIEVSGDWRHLGIANSMLKVALLQPSLDEVIVMCTGFSWHWDMDGLAVSKESYRELMLLYLDKAGFLYFDTDDPNVRLDPANFLTARIGPGVSAASVREFRGLLFEDGDADEERRAPRAIVDVLKAAGSGTSGPGEGLKGSGSRRENSAAEATWAE
ncbi:MAG: hypothetical protein ACYC55_09680 [Candidatus Geothermincolia bacterium]